MNLLGVDVQSIKRPKAMTGNRNSLQERGSYKRLVIGAPSDLYAAVWGILVLAPFAIYLLLTDTISNPKQLIVMGALAFVFYPGIIIHEMLHVLPYWKFRGRAKIHLYRMIIFIGGCLSVDGAVPYDLLQKSLWIPTGFGVVLGGMAAVCFFTGYSLAAQFLFMVSNLTIVAGGNDIYWSWNIRKIGNKAKYYDRGPILNVVWEEK